MKKILKNSTVFLLCTSLGIQPITGNRVYASSINSDIQLESPSVMNMEENSLTESSKEEEKEVSIEPIQSTEKDSIQQLETEENIEKIESAVGEETKKEIEKENEEKEEQVQETVQDKTKEELETTSDKTQQLDNEIKIEKKRVVREQTDTIENTPIDIEHINMAELEEMDTETLIVRWNATLLGKPLSNQQLEDVKQTLTKKDEPYKDGGDKTLEQALRNQALEYFQRLVTLQTLDTDTMDLKELLIMEREVANAMNRVTGFPSKQNIEKWVEDRMNKLESYEGAWLNETCEEYLRKEAKDFFDDLWTFMVKNKNLDVMATSLEEYKKFLEETFGCKGDVLEILMKPEKREWEENLNTYNTLFPDSELEITNLEYKRIGALFLSIPTTRQFYYELGDRWWRADQVKEEMHKAYKAQPVIFGSKRYV